MKRVKILSIMGIIIMGIGFLLFLLPFVPLKWMPIMLLIGSLLQIPKEIIDTKEKATTRRDAYIYTSGVRLAFIILVSLIVTIVTWFSK